MSTPPLPSSSQATEVSRDRDDACPGALRLHAADDGALARVRIPGGVLTTAQAEELGRAARELGDGELHLTSRGNLQLRGLAADCGTELARRLDAAGLLPSRRHERVRNIVASPLSGLDGRGFADVRPWLRELDALLCASEAAARLSGRFLFALDDGRGDVAGLGADVTLRAAPEGGAWLRIGAAEHVVSVAAGDGPRAALLAAETFLGIADGRAWRVTELTEEGAEVTRRVAASLRSPEAVDAPPWRTGEEPHPGVIEAPGGGTSLSVLAPLGRFTAGQWAELTAAAAGAGAATATAAAATTTSATATATGELRLTPWRGVILPMVRAEQADRLAAAGLVTDPASPWAGVGACIGRPGCAKSRADVRADAAAAHGTGTGTGTGTETGPGTGTRSAAGTAAAALPAYWSGCARRCGRPRGDHVDLVPLGDGTYEISVLRAGRVTATARTSDNPSPLAAAVTAARTHDQ